MTKGSCVGWLATVTWETTGSLHAAALVLAEWPVAAAVARAPRTDARGDLRPLLQVQSDAVQLKRTNAAQEAFLSRRSASCQRKKWILCPWYIGSSPSNPVMLHVCCLNVQSRWPVTVTKLTLCTADVWNVAWASLLRHLHRVHSAALYRSKNDHTGFSWDPCFTSSSTKTSFVCSFVTTCTTSPEVKPLPRMIKVSFDKDCRI